MVVKFRRKSKASPPTHRSTEPVVEPERDEPQVPESGPYDVDATPEGLVGEDWIDLGSLLVAPAPGKELRLQVDEGSGEIASVVLTAEDGAMEMRAFAAPRNGDLWGEALPLLRQDVQQRGGATADLDGPWGPELITQMRLELEDGQPAVQQTRIIGINGPRWMLRATMLGRPALEPEAGKEWEALLANVVVRRGDEARPKGEALDVVLPPNARRVGE